MKKLLYLCLILTACQCADAQVKIIPFAKNAVPKTLKYTGHIKNAISYSDSQGEHVVITSETGVVSSTGPDAENFRSAALYAYHYIKNGSILKLTWQTYDFIKDCGEDLTASYVPNTFAITDLNKDGKAEVWTMYKTVCHGDVSPCDMKIIMHEGDKKYAVRGTTKVKVSPTQYDGGEYAFDTAFKAGPQVFRDYATGLWKKNIADF